MNLNQVTLPALSLPDSVAFYRGLGLTLIVSSPHYARFECPDGGATLSLHQQAGGPPASDTVVYFECADLDARVAALQSRGYSFEQGPTHQPWLWREARLHDPSGNALCLYWAGEHRRFPPWRLEAAPGEAGAFSPTA